jgi:putative ABC transport system permease protein
MASLAVRNLFHDRVRLTVTLTGIVFAIVLIVVQLGLFLGFQQTTSTVIDNAHVDVWVAARGLQNFDVGTPIPESKYYQVLGTPGVAEAKKYLIQFVTWKTPTGTQESIEIIGFDPDSRLGAPWNLVAGNARDLKAADTVIIDELYKKKLGVRELGQTVEINGHRARVVGFTKGIRSFTTSPQVFTNFKNALDYSRVKENETTYVLAKTAPGIAPAELKRRLQARLEDVDVYTTPEFARRTRNYWMFTTGAGVTVLIAAALGLVVGLVVVAQTIYASTMDHIREFGTLKAMGASNGYIYRVIIQQAVLSAAIGYGFAMALSYPIVRLSAAGSAIILLPWQLAVLMLFISVGMCLAASLVSIRKVTTIDPAMVFKG